jgi:hypothetical protein
MLKANWFDLENAHVFSQCGFWTNSWPKRPKKVEWIKSDLERTNVAVVTEGYFKRSFIRSLEFDYKFAWVIESKGIHPKAYRKIRRLSHLFDAVFTHDRELIELGGNFVQVYVGSSRVEDSDIGVSFEKKNLVSLIASEKKQTNGHQLRHEVAKSFDGIDLWGRGYRKFESKREPLADYYYSIAIMNESYDYYFTEILIDCFIYKTIPIFWGCPNIADVFNPDGIIQFESLDDLSRVLPTLTPDDYQRRIPAIEENYRIAIDNFMITDDLVADEIMKRIQFK